MKLLLLLLLLSNSIKCIVQLIINDVNEISAEYGVNVPIEDLNISTHCRDKKRCHLSPVTNNTYKQGY